MFENEYSLPYYDLLKEAYLFLEKEMPRIDNINFPYSLKYEETTYFIQQLVPNLKPVFGYYPIDNVLQEHGVNIDSERNLYIDFLAHAYNMDLPKIHISPIQNHPIILDNSNQQFSGNEMTEILCGIYELQ